MGEPTEDNLSSHPETNFAILQKYIFELCFPMQCKWKCNKAIWKTYPTFFLRLSLFRKYLKIQNISTSADMYHVTLTLTPPKIERRRATHLPSSSPRTARERRLPRPPVTFGLDQKILQTSTSTEVFKVRWEGASQVPGYNWDGNRDKTRHSVQMIGTSKSSQLCQTRYLFSRTKMY